MGEAEAANACAVVTMAAIQPHRMTRTGNTEATNPVAGNSPYERGQAR